jgi:hypothetical protein
MVGSQSAIYLVQSNNQERQKKCLLRYIENLEAMLTSGGEMFMPAVGCLTIKMYLKYSVDQINILVFHFNN